MVSRIEMERSITINAPVESRESSATAIHTLSIASTCVSLLFFLSPMLISPFKEPLPIFSRMSRISGWKIMITTRSPLPRMVLKSLYNTLKLRKFDKAARPATTKRPVIRAPAFLPFTRCKVKNRSAARIIISIKSFIPKLQTALLQPLTMSLKFESSIDVSILNISFKARVWALKLF